jgi:hypothetical protein
LIGVRGECGCGKGPVDEYNSADSGALGLNISSIGTIPYAESRSNVRKYFFQIPLE